MIEKNYYSADGGFLQTGTPFDTTGEERNIDHASYRVIPSQFCLWNMPVRFSLIRNIASGSEGEAEG